MHAESRKRTFENVEADQSRIGDQPAVELHVVEADGKEWVVASEVATKILRWQPASLRRKLNQIDWPDKLAVRDAGVLRMVAKLGLVQGWEVPCATLGRARSVNLIAVDSLAELLDRLSNDTGPAGDGSSVAIVYVRSSCTSAR